MKRDILRFKWALKWGYDSCEIDRGYWIMDESHKYIQTPTPISYEKYTNVDLEINSLRTRKYPIGNEWHQISKYHNISLPGMWKSIPKKHPIV